ncbi:ferric reductase-like transmembrane domain-containing protein [Kitasatospora sp. HPMI-4]|uniref:ferric reductase-like transmembrane domain-containing protein n=1 Tax=Kitasatospora sp. HPMI-4 TaxID=3448443 RepID=UPI003F1BBF81
MTTEAGPARGFGRIPTSTARPRSATAVAVLVVLLATASLAVALSAPHASAAPIPGSPLDAYDHRVPYDTGVHHIARLAALTAYALMTATVVLGVVLRLRYFQRYVNRATMYGAHMVLALAALIFGGLHGATFVYQPIWRLGALDVLVPFLGGQQRIPVGLGVLGTELAVALGCSIWLQRRLGYRHWLRIHQFAYAAFALVWLHVLTVHPEPRHLDVVALGVALGAGTCLLLFLVRVLPSRSRLRQQYLLAGPGAAR